MRIVYVCNEVPPASAGGIGRFVDIVAGKLVEAHHDVSIIGVYDRIYDWQDKPYRVIIARPKPGITRRILQKPVLRKLVSSTIVERLKHLEICAAIRREIIAQSSGTSQTLVEWPSYQGQCNWKAKGITHVLRIHGANAMPAYADDKGAAKNIRNEIATARRINHWIGVSQWSIDELKAVSGNCPKSTRVIYNPVDCKKFCPANGNSLHNEDIVIYAGTLCDRKGDKRLASAANRFLENCPGSKLMYVGRHGNSRRSEILSLINPKLRCRVEFKNAVSQECLSRLMQKAAVFAMPSRGETFGMVYAEAMACGIPVVGGNNTGIPEIIPDGKAGFLIDADSVDAIAKSVETLLRNPELRMRMGQHGRRHVLENYDVDICVKASIQFYEECLNNESNGGLR